MTRRRLITWSAAVFAVVAVGVVAPWWEAWRCERLLPGVWRTTNISLDGDEYSVFRADGSLQVIACAPGVARPPHVHYRREGTYTLSACDVSMTLRRRRGSETLANTTTRRMQFSTPNDLRMRDEGGESWGSSYERVTNPPAWLEELLAALPEDGEAER